MKLNLTKPLIVFDLETTGLDMVKDRIIQISYIKVYPDGTEVRKTSSSIQRSQSLKRWLLLQVSAMMM